LTKRPHPADRASPGLGFLQKNGRREGTNRPSFFLSSVAFSARKSVEWLYGDHGFLALSRDGHFDRVKGLQRVAW
jgi:hypothetical protein